MAFKFLSDFFRWLREPPRIDRPEAGEGAKRSGQPEPAPLPPSDGAPPGEQPLPSLVRAPSQGEPQAEAEEEPPKVIEMPPKKRAQRAKRRRRAA